MTVRHFSPTTTPRWMADLRKGHCRKSRFYCLAQNDHDWNSGHSSIRPGRRLGHTVIASETNLFRAVLCLPLLSLLQQSQRRRICANHLMVTNHLDFTILILTSFQQTQSPSLWDSSEYIPPFIVPLSSTQSQLQAERLLHHGWHLTRNW